MRLQAGPVLALLACLALGGNGAAVSSVAESDSVGPVAWITVEAAIQPAVASFIERSIRWAEQSGAQCLVIELDTPGGLDASMRKVIKAIQSSTVPVVVYVAPPGSRAASAGAFITIAAHVAAMAPGTNIGAAHPVAVGGIVPGKAQPDSTMLSKLESDAVAYIRSLAEQRGRNAEWAERAVRESESITAEEALRLGVVDLVAGDAAELLAQLDGKEVHLTGRSVCLHTMGAVILRRSMGLRDRVLSVIADPNVAYILLLLGVLGIFFELSHPGTLFPGIVGALSLFLAFFAFQMLPVRAAGVALVVLAIVFFILEIKITSYGALAMAGIASLLFGTLMLFEGGPGRVGLSVGVWVPTLVLVSLVFVGAIVLAVKAQRTKRLTGPEGLLGEVGLARSDLLPEGRVFVHGEIWNARSADGSAIPAGARVKVVRVEGLRVLVEAVEEER